MLAHIYEPKRWPTGQQVAIQPKFDGIRALYQAGHFQSRDELPMPEGLLKHLVDPLKEMFPDERVILDGELYVHGWPLGRINGAVTPVRNQPNEDTVQVEYYVFDRVQYHVPFLDRFYTVHDVIRELGREVKINVATTLVTKDPQDADNFYAMVVNEGFEGIMYRVGECPYTVPKQNVDPFANYKTRLKCLSDKNNRTWHLLKRKDWQDDEFRCLGVTQGEGKANIGIGALICEPLGQERGDPPRHFKVGSGFTDEERIAFAKNPPIGRLVKIKFRCYTADGLPFNPTVITVL